MTAACPSTQVRVKRRIHAHESLFGDHRCIVVTPSSNDGVEALDQHFLRRGSQASHFLMHPADVSTLAACRGLHMGLKAQRFALSGCAGFGVTDRVLPNVETEEIKPCGAFNRVERMPDPRFTGLQGSPHLL